MLERVGLSDGPWGTPRMSLQDYEKYGARMTACVLSIQKEQIQRRADN